MIKQRSISVSFILGHTVYIYTADNNNNNTKSSSRRIQRSMWMHVSLSISLSISSSKSYTLFNNLTKYGNELLRYLSVLHFISLYFSLCRRRRHSDCFGGSHCGKRSGNVWANLVHKSTRLSLRVFKDWRLRALSYDMYWSRSITLKERFWILSRAFDCWAVKEECQTGQQYSRSGLM